jgi:hypothetical protein
MPIPAQTAPAVRPLRGMTLTHLSWPCRYGDRMADPLTAWPADPHGWIRSTEARAFPSRFYVQTELDGYKVTMLAEVGPRGPGATHVAVRQPAGRDGPPVSMTVLRRVAVDHFLSEAVDRLSRPAVADDSEPGAFRVEGVAGLWHGPVPRLSGRGSQTTDTRLQRVAEVYLDAVAAGKPPVKEVTNQLHFSRSTAGRLVGQARKAGLLAPTTRGRRGTLADLILLAQQLEDAGGEITIVGPPGEPQPQPELPPRRGDLQRGTGRFENQEDE